MNQQLNKKKRRLSRAKIQRFAKLTWIITSWIWTALIVGILINLIPTLLTNNLKDSRTAFIIEWLYNPDLNWWRLAALSFLIVFVFITLLSFLFKQVLQSGQIEGFEKLLSFLQDDTIPPQLDHISDQLKQQIDNQQHIVTHLKHVYALLQQDSTSIRLQDLQSSVEQQRKLQDKIYLALRNTQKALRQATIPNQLERFADLYQQDQQTLRMLSANVQHISNCLERVLDKSGIPLSLAQDGSELSDDQPTTTEHMHAVIPLLPQDQAQQQESNPQPASNDTSVLDSFD